MLTGDRMAAHADAVIDVASRSISQAIEGFDKDRVGSFVMACSTGYVNPGPDLLLAKELGLRSDLRRTFIGHMGCYAALNVIKVAMDSVAARPDELVICNCTELSSAHVRNSPMPDEDPTESLITQALFGDASVSMLMGSAPDGAGIQFLRTHTEQLYDQDQMMSLNIGNQSFWMTLAAGVPAVLQENIEGFLVKLLQPLGLSASDVSHWGIHPGGPKILRVLGKQLALQPAQLRASWDVLANAGNCASATVLLVLENILRVDKPRRGRVRGPVGVRAGAHHRGRRNSLLNQIDHRRGPPYEALIVGKHTKGTRGGGNVLEGIARLAIRAPRRIIAIALLVMAGAAVFGIPVANSLSAGGFEDPTAGSAHAAQLLAGKFDQGDMQMLITVSSNGGAQSGAARAVGTDIVARLHNSPYVAQVISPWTAPPSVATSLISKDGNTGLIVAGITGGQNGAQQHAETLSNELVHDRDGVTVRAGGDAIAATQINLQTQEDLKLMEIHRDPAELSGAGVGVRWRGSGGAAVGGRRLGDLRFDGRAARDHLRDRRVDLRAESVRRDGAGVGDRLHAADSQPVPRRACQRRRARRGADAHDGHRRPDRAVLGDDGGAVDVGDGAVSDVLPEVIRLRRRRGGGARGRRRDRGDAGGHCAARPTIGLL